MLPIAATAAEAQNIPLEKMAFLLMLAASASFMSPFGYQTNLMVYGPGGYVFADFVKFGFPMQLVLLVVTIAIVGIDKDVMWIPCVVVVIGFAVAVVATTVGLAAAYERLQRQFARVSRRQHRRRSSDITLDADANAHDAVDTV